MRTCRLIALWLLVGVAFTLQGCSGFVFKSRYDALKAERDDLKKLAYSKDEDAKEATDSFRKRLEDATQELDMYKSQATGSKEEAEKLRKALEAKSKDRAKLDEDLGKVGPVKQHRLILEEAILFGPGEDLLSSQGKKTLDKLAAVAKSKHALIEIVGHTDASAITKSATKRAHGDNMGLSVHRALTVFRYLRDKQIPESRMFIRALGAVSGAGRRVEIHLIPQEGEHRSTPEHKAAPEPKKGPERKTGTEKRPATK